MSVDSGSGESSAIEYFEHTEGTDTTGLILFATYLKINLKDRGRMICPFSTAVAEMLASTTNTIIAAGINLHEKCIGDTGNGIVEMTVKDLLIQNGYTQERLDAIPRITKEEFYSLEPI